MLKEGRNPRAGRNIKKGRGEKKWVLIRKFPISRRGGRGKKNELCLTL